MPPAWGPSSATLWSGREAPRQAALRNDHDPNRRRVSEWRKPRLEVTLGDVQVGGAREGAQTGECLPRPWANMR